MDVASQFFFMFILSFLGAMSPGPDFIILLKNCLSHSRNAGLYTTLGLCLGVIVHLTYSIAGIGLLIIESTFLFQSVKYVGAIYLIYLGCKGIFFSTRKFEINNSKHLVDIRPESYTYIQQGFLTNILNPKAALFYVSLFSQFISPKTTLEEQLCFAMINLLSTASWFILLTFLCTNKMFLSKITKYKIYFEKVMGGCLIILGLKIIFI